MLPYFPHGLYGSASVHIAHSIVACTMLNKKRQQLVWRRWIAVALATMSYFIMTINMP
eukprot:m.1116302 g.1116302  ORF g.1116302 m.1116302 type:complete len:58 (-) comp24375_c0_seq14:221-394(-)